MSEVFKSRPDGSLELVGDFDAKYSAESDPWHQSGAGAEGEYYGFARTNLLRLLAERRVGPTLEVGCGLGHVVDLICRHHGPCAGSDISAVAIDRAVDLYPDRTFYQHDICAGPLSLKFSAVILNQCLWYLNDLAGAILNSFAMVRPGGLVIICQGFVANPKFDVDGVDDFDSLLGFCWESGFPVIEARHDDSGRCRLADGIVAIRRGSDEGD